MTSAPGCWALYTEVLGREYSNQDYFAVHQLTVDAYAVQHPGGDNPQARQSVIVHLAALCGHFEHRLPAPMLIRLRKEMAKQRPLLLFKPPYSYDLTVLDVFRAQSAVEHSRLVSRWAYCVWAEWLAQAEPIRQQVKALLVHL